GRWTPASDLLLHALDAALWAAAATGGAVDPTIGRALRVAGYDRDFAAIPPDGGPLRLAVEAVPGWRVVELDRGRGRARLAPGTHVRRWMRGGVEMHHIIAPATGAPVAGPWRTATVAAATCLEANAAATAAIVKGDGAERWLGERRLPARLVDLRGEVVALGG